MSFSSQASSSSGPGDNRRPRNRIDDRHDHDSDEGSIPVPASPYSEDGNSVHHPHLEHPMVTFGEAHQVKKGEDFFLIRTDIERVLSDGTSHFHVFGVFDGHNGRDAAVFVKEHLLSDILAAIPEDLDREGWLEALCQAMVAGFVKTDRDFSTQKIFSGCTATMAVVDEWTVTVACVGDSRCILDTQDASVMPLTIDHRLEDNKEEVERVKRDGGEIGRLRTEAGDELGPLRCWPGGLCLSRSIGDIDVGPFIVPVPCVKQVKLPTKGGRLIMASDGVWDALDNKVAAKCCRGKPPAESARAVVKEAIKKRGLRDDTTCIVVDITPPNQPVSTVVMKKPNKFSKFFGKVTGKMGAVPEGGAVLDDSSVPVVVFDENSSRLADRLRADKGFHRRQSGFRCAICNLDLEGVNGFSVHAGDLFAEGKVPYEGPFLCKSCKDKQKEMEGWKGPQSNGAKEPQLNGEK